MPDQLQHEFEQTLDEALRLMKAFDFVDFQYVLSTRAPEDRGESDAVAEAAIRNALERSGLPFDVDEGGGAFYGPKLDINVRDALGRPWQLGTVQVDFILPARFDLKYRAADGQDHQPVMIHRALAGSLERFFGILVEHYGAPFRHGWRRFKPSSRPSPSTKWGMLVRWSTGSGKRAFGPSSTNRTKNSATRFGIGKTQKVPYILVAGKREVEDGTVNINQRGIEEKRTISIDSFVEELETVVEARR